jgi:hypothetical protein
MQQLTFSEYLKLLKRKIQLRIAINVADTKQQAFNKRYYVLPDENNKLQALCADDIDYLKKPIKTRVFVKGHYKEVKKRDGSIKRKYVKGGYKIHKFYFMNPKATHSDVMKECFYVTKASLNDKPALDKLQREEKKKQWLKYAKRWNL